MARLDNNTFDDREIQRRIFDDEGFQYNRDVSANTKLTTIIASLATVIAAVVAVGVLISTLTVELQQSNPLEIAQGNVAGFTHVNKFGENDDIDSDVLADIWDGGKTVGALPAGTSLIWLAPTAAAVHNITSTSALDDGDPGGSGARTIAVFGLSDWDTAETSDTLTLNGTSNVATSAYVIIHRLKVLTMGSTSNAGTITATATAPSATTVTARVEVGHGSSHMAIYGIPSTQIGYMTNVFISALKSGGATGLADVNLLLNPEPDVQTTGYIRKETFGLEDGGTSSYNSPFMPPKVFPGPAIIKFQTLSGAANMAIVVSFDLVLVDN